MPIDPLPSISRSDANFRTQVDDYFLTRLPAFSTQAESARVQIVGAESAAASAASTATTAAATATSAASGASSSASSAATSASTAATAKNAAEAAAAQAVSGNVATPIHEAVSKTTPVDADEIGLSDSAATWALKKLTFANLKATLAAWIGGGTVAGSFTNLAASNTIVSSKDGGLVLSAGGTTTSCFARFLNTGGSLYAGIESSAGFTVLGAAGAYASVFGTGGATPLHLVTNNLTRLKIESSGDVLVTGGGLGYGVGSGGAVTQATSRTTGVALNKPSGQITLVSAAGTTAWQSFTLTNSSIAAQDGVVVSQRSGTDVYLTHVTAKAAGSCRITFATTGGTTTEQPVFDFQVVKGSVS